jgi:general secretion pathway protein C
MRNIWTPRLLTFALWLLAAASATYWLLQTAARAAPNPALAQATVAGQGKTQTLKPDSLAVAHGLGAVGDGVAIAAVADGTPSVDWNPSRFALSGIVAQGSEKDGLVMISVDGKPAQILQVGATVEPNVVVQALSRQSVTLANISKADAPVLLTLKLGEKPGSSTNAHAEDHNNNNNSNSNNSNAAAPVAEAVPPAPIPAPPPPAPAPVEQAAAATPEANADTEREARRARMAERISERRASNVNNATGSSNANNNANNASKTAPRRSVLSDDNLYFGD